MSAVSGVDASAVLRATDLPAPRLPASRLTFEIYRPGPRDVLRTVLASCVEACLAFWRTVRSLGFGSTPSLTNKLPFYKAALRRPQLVRYSHELEWLREVESRPRKPTPLGARPRPRPRYWRDFFGPGVVMPLNFFLGWLLINADLINIRL